jgi:hypothetical protein
LGKQPVGSTQPVLAQTVALTQLQFWVHACISRTALFISNVGGQKNAPSDCAQRMCDDSNFKTYIDSGMVEQRLLITFQAILHLYGCKGKYEEIGI